MQSSDTAILWRHQLACQEPRRYEQARIDQIPKQLMVVNPPQRGAVLMLGVASTRNASLQNHTGCLDLELLTALQSQTTCSRCSRAFSRRPSSVLMAACLCSSSLVPRDERPSQDRWTVARAVLRAAERLLTSHAVLTPLPDETTTAALPATTFIPPTGHAGSRTADTRTHVRPPPSTSSPATGWAVPALCTRGTRHSPGQHHRRTRLAAVCRHVCGQASCTRGTVVPDHLHLRWKSARLDLHFQLA